MTIDFNQGYTSDYNAFGKLGHCCDIQFKIITKMTDSHLLGPSMRINVR